MSKLLQYTFIFASIFLTSNLQAEIQQVTVRWDSLLCRESCNNQLERRFRDVPAVAALNYNPQAGLVDLYWKPNSSFKINDVMYVMQALGLQVKDFRVRVRGTIVHRADTIKIRSIGDNTEFLLLSPITTSKTQMVTEYNVETHILQPNIRRQLMDAEGKYQMVTIEGPLFEIERYDLKLIIDKLLIHDYGK